MIKSPVIRFNVTIIKCYAIIWFQLHHHVNEITKTISQGEHRPSNYSTIMQSPQHQHKLCICLETESQFTPFDIRRKGRNRGKWDKLLLRIVCEGCSCLRHIWNKPCIKSFCFRMSKDLEGLTKSQVKCYLALWISRYICIEVKSEWN